MIREPVHEQSSTVVRQQCYATYMCQTSVISIEGTLQLQNRVMSTGSYSGLYEPMCWPVLLLTRTLEDSFGNSHFYPCVTGFA